jgi:hypothetical protein
VNVRSWAHAEGPLLTNVYAVPAPESPATVLGQDPTRMRFPEIAIGLPKEPPVE